MKEQNVIANAGIYVVDTERGFIGRKAFNYDENYGGWKPDQEAAMYMYRTAFIEFLHGDLTIEARTKALECCAKGVFIGQDFVRGVKALKQDSDANFLDIVILYERHSDTQEFRTHVSVSGRLSEDGPLDTQLEIYELASSFFGEILRKKPLPFVSEFNG